MPGRFGTALLSISSEELIPLFVKEVSLYLDEQGKPLHKIINEIRKEIDHG